MASRKRPLAESNVNLPPVHRQRTSLETKQLAVGRENAAPSSNPHDCKPNAATLLQAPALYDATGRPAIHWPSPQHQFREPYAPSAQNVARRSSPAGSSLQLGTYQADQAACPGGRMAFQPERQWGRFQFPRTGPAPMYEHWRQTNQTAQSQQHPPHPPSGSYYDPTQHDVPPPQSSQPLYLEQQGSFQAPHHQRSNIDHARQPMSQAPKYVNPGFRPYYQQQQQEPALPPPHAFRSQQYPSAVVKGQFPPHTQSAICVTGTSSGTERTGTSQGARSLPPVQHVDPLLSASSSFPSRAEMVPQLIGSACETSLEHRLDAAGQSTRATTGITHRANPSRMVLSAPTVAETPHHSNSVASCGDEEPPHQPRESPEQKLERIRKAMAGAESDVYTVIEETDDGYGIGGTDVVSVHRTFDGAFESVNLAVIGNSWLERRPSRNPATARAVVTDHDNDEEKAKQKRNVIRRASLGGDSVSFQFDESNSDNEGEATYWIRRHRLQS